MQRWLQHQFISRSCVPSLLRLSCSVSYTLYGVSVITVCLYCVYRLYAIQPACVSVYFYVPDPREDQRHILVLLMWILPKIRQETAKILVSIEDDYERLPVKRFADMIIGNGVFLMTQSDVHWIIQLWTQTGMHHQEKRKTYFILYKNQSPRYHYYTKRSSNVQQTNKSTQ